jgi:uncharacterized protein
VTRPRDTSDTNLTILPDERHRSEGQADITTSAGGFVAWLHDHRSAVAGEQDADVACGECTACCRSAQFVHISPDEIDTLEHIEPDLLFPAPRMPDGHVLLGYDEAGQCPMLDESGCSIYQHRPRTCRTYDCRIFAAAGIDADDDKPLITERARQWQFDLATDRDRSASTSVHAAATSLMEHEDTLPDDIAPRNQAQLALLAVEIHGAFVEQGPATVDLVALLRSRDPT